MNAACIRIGMIALCLWTVVSTACAQADKPPAPKTTKNPTISVDRLKLLVKPLTADELVVEADGWLGLLQAKMQEITDAELDVKQTTADIAETKEQAKAAETKAEPAQAKEQQEQVEAEVAQKAAKKSSRLERLNALREQRTALIDRVNTVLAELELKGGDPAKYRKYVAAVSGITVDVNDWQAALAAITGWLRSKEGGVRWLRNIILFIVTLIVFRVAAGLLSAATARALRFAKGQSDLLRNFLAHTVRNVVFIVGIVVALSMLEIDIGPMIAAIGAAGFVLAFALQGTLSNFAAGVMILLYRPFDVGHVISTAGVTGKVESMSLVSTTVKTPDNQTVVVPNNSIWGGVITNITGNDTRRLDMVFGIGYSDDIPKAKQLLQSIVERDQRILKDPAPMIAVLELADSSVNIACRPWVRTAEYWDVKLDLLETVKREFDEQGISIPFPQRDVHLFQQPAG